MRKTLRTSLCIALLGWAGTAQADINFYEMQTGYVFTSKGESLTWTFNLENGSLLSDWDGSGSDPYGSSVKINPEDQITSAWIEIGFYDNDPDLGTNNNEISPESANLKVDTSSLFQNREINTEYYYSDINISFLYDHILEITIKDRSGDFEVYGVLLGGSFIDNPPLNNSPVPLPSSILLLGTSLVGLAGVRRKN